MPEATPERVKRGCLSAISLIGGFAAGVYVGYNQAHGNDLSPLVRSGLFLVPTGLSGILGYRGGKDFGSDPQAMREFTNIQLRHSGDFVRSVIDPEKLARYNSSRAANRGAIGGVISTGVATAIGYGLAKLCSN